MLQIGSKLTTKHSHTHPLMQTRTYMHTHSHACMHVGIHGDLVPSSLWWQHKSKPYS